MVIFALGGSAFLTACDRRLNAPSMVQLTSTTMVTPGVTAITSIGHGYPEPESTLSSGSAPDNKAYPLDTHSSPQDLPYPLGAESVLQPTTIPGSYPGPATNTTIATTESSPTQTRVGQPTQSQPIVSTPSPTAIRVQITASPPDAFSLSAGRPQLVEFFANWSIVSRSMAPVILGIEDEFNNQVNIFYLDIDDPRTIPIQHKLGYVFSSQPHFYLIDGQGGVIKEWIGYVSAAELEGAIMEILVGAPAGN